MGGRGKGGRGTIDHHPDTLGGFAARPIDRHFLGGPDDFDLAFHHLDLALSQSPEYEELYPEEAHLVCPGVRQPDSMDPRHQ
jgi:hypothetical protein